MGKIIKLYKKHIDEEQINKLQLEMSKIIGDSEMIETEDGDFIMDAVSEAKVDALREKIKLEMLRGGYSLSEVEGIYE